MKKKPSNCTKEALSSGHARDIKNIYKTAGVEFDFSAKHIRSLANHLLHYLNVLVTRLRWLFHRECSLGTLIERCRERPGFWCRWFVAQGAVRTNLIVLLPPSFDQPLGLLDRREDFAIQQFVP